MLSQSRVEAEVQPWSFLLQLCVPGKAALVSEPLCKTEVIRTHTPEVRRV